MIWNLSSLCKCLREYRLHHAFPEIADPRLRRLARAIGSLPDAEHEVFRLARYEDLTVPQIGVRLGVAEHKALSLLASAIILIGRSVRRQERKGW